MPVAFESARTIPDGSEISRLLTAAVINSRFCKLLLADPVKALALGFNGEQFHFAKDERERIQTIRAQSLADFANQLTSTLNLEIRRTPSHIHSGQPAYLPAGLD